MNMISKRYLQSQTLEYIYSCLEQGKTLSSLLGKLDLTKGYVWTYLPLEVSDETAHQFMQGGISNIDSPKPYLGMLIRQFLADTKSAYCIFEDALARSDDLNIQQTTIPCFFLDKEVYYFLKSKDTDIEMIGDVISASESYLLTGIMTHIPSDSSEISERQHMPVGELKNLVGQIEMLVIGAYDGEGFIIWSRECD